MNALICMSPPTFSRRGEICCGDDFHPYVIRGAREIPDRRCLEDERRIVIHCCPLREEPGGLESAVGTGGHYLVSPAVCSALTLPPWVQMRRQAFLYKALARRHRVLTRKTACVLRDCRKRGVKNLTCRILPPGGGCLTIVKWASKGRLLLHLIRPLTYKPQLFHLSVRAPFPGRTVNPPVSDLCDLEGHGFVWRGSKSCQLSQRAWKAGG